MIVGCYSFTKLLHADKQADTQADTKLIRTLMQTDTQVDTQMVGVVILPQGKILRATNALI